MRLCQVRHWQTNFPYSRLGLVQLPIFTVGSFLETTKKVSIDADIFRKKKSDLIVFKWNNNFSNFYTKLTKTFSLIKILKEFERHSALVKLFIFLDFSFLRIYTISVFNVRIRVLLPHLQLFMPSNNKVKMHINFVT